MKLTKIEAVRQLLEAQGDTPEEIEKTLNLIRINENKDFWNDTRSWISVLISLGALVVSVTALCFSLK